MDYELPNLSYTSREHACRQVRIRLSEGGLLEAVSIQNNPTEVRVGVSSNA